MPGPSAGSGAAPGIIIATASYDRTIRFWEATTGICMRQLNFQDSQVNCMCVSPCKTRLAAAGHQNARLYDLTSPNQLNPVAAVDGHSGNITSVSFIKMTSGGCFLLTTSEDGHWKCWDYKAATMRLRRDVDSETPINCAIAHPDQSCLYIGSQNGSVSVWSLTSTPASDDTLGGALTGAAGGLVQKLVLSEDQATRSLAVTPSGDLLCAANNAGTVFCLLINGADNTDAPRHLTLVHQFQAHNRYILKCVISPNGKLLATASADSTIQLWNVPQDRSPEGITTWTAGKPLLGHQRWAWDCGFSSDSGYLVSVSSDHTGRLWDLNANKLIVAYNGHQKPVTCVVLDDKEPQPV